MFLPCCASQSAEEVLESLNLLIIMSTVDDEILKLFTVLYGETFLLNS